MYQGGGRPSKSGRGLYAQQIMDSLPELPFEEEGRLRDARLRENLLERVFAYKRLQTLFRARWKLGDLVRFHTAEKLRLNALRTRVIGVSSNKPSTTSEKALCR